MARVIGLGITEQNTSKETINLVDFISYINDADIESRVFKTRKLRLKDLFTASELISLKGTALSDKKFASSLTDIIIRENESIKETGAYDVVFSKEKNSANFTTRFMECPIGSLEKGISKNKFIKLINENISFLRNHVANDKIIVSLALKNGKTDKKSDSLTIKELIEILIKERISLSIDINELNDYAKKEDMAKSFAKICKADIGLIRIGDSRLDENLKLIASTYKDNRLSGLKGILYTGSSPEAIIKIKETLIAAGATLFSTIMHPDYYFSEWKTWTHSGIFDNTSYVYHALKNIPSYCQSFVEKKMNILSEKKASFSGELMKSTSGSYIIEDGAFVQKGTEIGLGVTIKKGAYVESGASILGNSYIGENVYISSGAKLLNCTIRDGVYIGKNIKMDGPCVIEKNVILDDNVKLVRNSVIENLVYVNQGTVIDGATMGNRVILEKNIQILPGAYIRKDTIFGLGVVFRSEAKNTVIMDAEEVFDFSLGKNVFAGSESGHYGYVGDSILGKLVNEGAGDKNSNVKNNWGEANVNIDGWTFHSGLMKFGAIIGDYTTVGCLTVLEPGTLIGKACNIYASKVRTFIQTASVYNDKSEIKHRHSDQLPRVENALEGRSAPVINTIKAFEKSEVKRIG